MTYSTLKLLIAPIVLILAVTVIYAVSIDLNTINRADIAFGLMGILALANAWIAYRWFGKGFQTFEMMKHQEKVATSIITKLIRKYEPNEKHETVIENILTEQLSDVVKDLTAIIDKHKS